MATDTQLVAGAQPARQPLPDKFQPLGFSGVKLQCPRQPQAPWTLLHPITLERAQLPTPSGSYILEWLGQDVAVCDTGSDFFMEAESVFSKIPVVDTISGERKIACWLKAKQRWRMLDYVGTRTEYRNIVISLFLGPTKTKQDIAAVILRLPRHSGSLIYWEAVAIYNILNLSSHQKVPSKWVFKSKKHWQSFFSELGLAEQLLHSSRAIIEDGASPECAFLPYTCVSTAGMLALLARWRLGNPRAGGLRDENARAAATTLLHGMVDGISDSRECHLDLCLDSTRWEPAWPAATSHVDVSLPARSGQVDLQQWRALAATPGCPYDASSILMECGLVSCCEVSAASLLEKLFALKRPPAYLIYQVSVQAARWIDVALFKSAEGNEIAKSNKVSSKAKYPTVMDVVDKPDLMNPFLWRHVQGSLAESRGSTCLSLTSDSGHCGMKLDCGFFVHQSGLVSVAVPQVCLVCIGWGSGHWVAEPRSPAPNIVPKPWYSHCAAFVRHLLRGRPAPLKSKSSYL